ncbi:hypothetical protein IKF26_01025 [Candidatus Saccharibacteria bacterium]|nr:hypothetical protein [Candidatus Saccharibacteria bacterium]
MSKIKSNTNAGYKAKPRKITHNGITYSCLRKNGKITVRISRTAKGQNIIVGVYDIINGTWHNDNSDVPLTEKTKEKILNHFVKAQPAI